MDDEEKGTSDNSYLIGVKRVWCYAYKDSSFIERDDFFFDFYKGECSAFYLFEY